MLCEPLPSNSSWAHGAIRLSVGYLPTERYRSEARCDLSCESKYWSKNRAHTIYRKYTDSNQFPVRLRPSSQTKLIININSYTLQVVYIRMSRVCAEQHALSPTLPAQPGDSLKVFEPFFLHLYPTTLCSTRLEKDQRSGNGTRAGRCPRPHSA